MENKTVLIIGGAGAVGSQLTNKLTKICKKVIVLDNLSSGYTCLLRREKNLLFIKGDIRNDSDLRRCFNEKPDIIFHLAAFFANQNSVDYPQEDISVNGVGTLKLYEYSAIYGNVEKIVYASSRSILGEAYGNYFIRQYGLNISYARFFNSFGPGEFPGQYRNVIPNFIYWALSEKSLPITGTGEETRDFTSVNDIVNGLILMAMADNISGEAFNLAAGREIQIKYLAELINEKTDNPSPIVYKPRRNWDSKPRLLSSNEKAKKVLNFQPDLNFEDNIEKTVEWFKNNWSNVKKNAAFGPGMSSAVRD